MNGLLWTLRIAARSWLRSPLLAVTAVATLGLGIGVATAVFSVASGVLINVVPWENRARMVAIDMTREPASEQAQAVTEGALYDWTQQSRSFDGLVGTQFWPVNLTDGKDGGEVVVGPRVTPRAATLIGVKLLLGRDFGPQDAEPGAPAVAILSHGLWMRRYGGDPGLVNRTIEIDNQPVTVVGVFQREHFFPFPNAELVTPLRIAQNAQRSIRSLNVFGILKSGVTLEEAGTELGVINARLAEQYPATDAGWTVRVRTLREWYSGGQRTRLGVGLLFVAVLFLLLIMCANVANLLLARSAARTKEIATRCAVGASRGQIMGQLLLESLLLAALATPLALLVGRGSIELMMGLVPANFTWIDQIFRFDGPVLLFAVLASVGTLLVFGLIPAVQASRVNLQHVLKEGGGRGSTAARPWLRQVLAVAQLGLAISLLAASTIIVQRFNLVQRRDPGIEVEQLYVTAVQLPAARYPEATHWREFEQDLLRSLRGLPGVQSASAVNFAPFGFPGPQLDLAIEGKVVPSDAEKPSSYLACVSPEYFRTTGLRVVRGREFTPDDRAGGVPVAAISETLARRYLDGEEPIGRRMQIAGETREVVAVISDYYNVGLRDPPMPQVFVPFDQLPTANVGILVRSTAPMVSLGPSLRTALRQLDATLPLPALQPMDQRVADSVWTARFLEQVMLLLSGVALFLAGLGVYAVISYAATLRTQEFAIRAALGASPGGIATLVMRQAARLAVWGTGLAALLTMLQWPLLRQVIEAGVQFNALHFAAIALLLTAIALVAALEPALRATRTDPMDALRAE